ncbi:MAG: hypothetical protein JWO68_1785, partial [Actinomycetia bacterium]|nr:hypothetical protein [Actinomycetes bacterium]
WGFTMAVTSCMAGNGTQAMVAM